MIYNVIQLLTKSVSDSEHRHPNAQFINQWNKYVRKYNNLHKHICKDKETIVPISIISTAMISYKEGQDNEMFLIFSSHFSQCLKKIFENAAYKSENYMPLEISATADVILKSF